jgi:predicted kinase
MAESPSSGPVLVVVSGPPCTGKTTLARQIATEFGLPFYYKDGLKETLCDALGCGDVAWSRRLSSACMELLYHIARTELAVGRSLGIEANFRPELAGQSYRNLCTTYACRPIEVHCTADAQITVQRFRQRGASGARHPGHHDAKMAATVAKNIIGGVYGPLELGGPLLRIDTTDWSAVDSVGILTQIAAWLGKSTTS